MAARESAEAEDDVEDLLRADLGDTPHLGFEYEPSLRTLWVTLRPRPLPCFTPELIDSLLRLQAAVAGRWGGPYPTLDQPIKFAVIRSDAPGVFSSGGDLGLILSRIDAGDHAGLLAYGHAGTRACHGLVDGFGACVSTVALVQGSALGSGFEAARSCDTVVAEEGATFQLPEAKFSLFPGNGAVSVLSRRIGGALVRRMILGGARLDLDEAKAAGIVDRVAPSGGGEEAVRALVKSLLPRHAAVVAVSRGLSRADGITLGEMLAETDRWADAALRAAPDLRAMRRIVAAQSRRFQEAGQEG